MDSKKKVEWTILITCLLACSICAQEFDIVGDRKGVDWIRNPLAVYCEELGYEYVIVDTPEGQTGVCRFSETENASDIGFYTGREKQELSYCARKGLETKTIKAAEECGADFPVECTVCVLEDGSQMEASKLMEYDRETMGELAPPTTVPPRPPCGDGVCELGEELTCPTDCPKKQANILPIIAAVLIIAVIAILLSKKGKKKPPAQKPATLKPPADKPTTAGEEPEAKTAKEDEDIPTAVERK